MSAETTAPRPTGIGEGRGECQTTLKCDSRLTTAQQEVIQQAPPKYRKLVRQALQGATSPRRAIQANCLTCTHYDVAQIRECVVLRCTVHAYRPYQRDKV